MALEDNIASMQSCVTGSSVPQQTGPATFTLHGCADLSRQINRFDFYACRILTNSSRSLSMCLEAELNPCKVPLLPGDAQPGDFKAAVQCSALGT